MKYTEYDQDEEYVEFEDVKCRVETDSAILCDFDSDDVFSAPIWVPKSIVHDDSEVYKKDTDGTLIIARWWADKEGLT
jgi:hypothetical protein